MKLCDGITTRGRVCTNPVGKDFDRCRFHGGPGWNGSRLVVFEDGGIPEDDAKIAEVLISMGTRIEAAPRFYVRVDFADPKSNGCDIWTGARNPKGYGVVWYRGRSYLAHRLAWELAHAETATGPVRHRCDIRACVKAEHLVHEAGA